MKTMKRLIALPIALLLAGVTDAQPVSPPAPSLLAAATTQPASAAVLTSQPAPAIAAQPGPPRLLLLPFTGVDPSDRRDWIGRGLLASLEGDLSRLATIQPITLDLAKPENAPPAAGYDTEAVLKLARSVGARYAIYGTYQTNDPELRLVGIILDVQTARPVGGMKATGTVRDIFGMEDSISTQAKRQLPRELLATDGNSPAAPVVPQTPANPNQTGPVRNPFPNVVFDDDAAQRAIDRLRYRDDWDGSYFPSPYSYFGFGPIFGFGGGYRSSYYRSYRSSADPISTPPVERSHDVFSGQLGSANPLFRGGSYLDSAPATLSISRSTGFVSSGGYAWPTQRSGSYSHTISQSGNYVHATGTLGGSARPAPPLTASPHPASPSGYLLQSTR